MTARVPAAVTPTTLSPVLLLLDAGDDHAIHHAAHQRARPERGCITADPTPHTNSLAYLALDLLRAMGRDSFTRPDAERMSTDAAWRAVTCWTLTTGLKQACEVRGRGHRDVRVSPPLMLTRVCPGQSMFQMVDLGGVLPNQRWCDPGSAGAVFVEPPLKRAL
ncbi:hypothetical protein [Streptomyces sp. NPDC088928]|uniref:hypothetical protein n=1 Tax=Streptomyces sp. NPDC088928 TaxID=3365915 RepID=UPI0038246B7A